MITSTAIKLSPARKGGKLPNVSPKGFDAKTGKSLGGPGKGQGRKPKIGYRKVSFKLHEETISLMQKLPSETRFETVDKILRASLKRLLKVKREC
jgi:hypothetical protein